MAKCPTTTQSLCCRLDSRGIPWCYCIPTRCDDPLCGQAAPRPTSVLVWNRIHSRIYVCPQSSRPEWQGSSDCRVLCYRESGPPHLDLWDYERFAGSAGSQGTQTADKSRICDPCCISLIPTRCPHFHFSVGDVRGHRGYDSTATDNVLVLFLPTIFPDIMPYPERIQDPSLVRRAGLPPTLVSRDDRIECTRRRGPVHKSDNTRFQSHEGCMGGHTPERASPVYIGVSSTPWGEDGFGRSSGDGWTVACRSAVR